MLNLGNKWLVGTQYKRKGGVDSTIRRKDIATGREVEAVHRDGGKFGQFNT